MALGNKFRSLHFDHQKGPITILRLATQLCDALGMFRTLASYNVEIGTPGAAELRAMLSAMKFEGSKKRFVAPSFDQVTAIVSTAEKMGYRRALGKASISGKIPRDCSGSWRAGRHLLHGHAFWRRYRS